VDLDEADLDTDADLDLDDLDADEVDLQVALADEDLDGADDIADIVSSWTGIPVMRLVEEETEKLLRMEDSLHGRIVGQEEAVHAVARAVRRARAGLKDARRPIGSFIFLGPTGVGKTELTLALAEFLFGDVTYHREILATEIGL